MIPSALRRLFLIVLHGIALPPVSLADTSGSFEGAPPPTVAYRCTKGKVVFVDARNRFIIMELGKKDGIHMDEWALIRGAKGESLALAAVEKYMGANGSMTKLEIVSGDPKTIRLDDGVEVFCKHFWRAPGGRGAPFEEKRVRAFGIKGFGHRGYRVAFGEREGARRNQLLPVLREGSNVGAIRLHTVHPGYSIGRPEEGLIFRKGDSVLAPLASGD